MPRITSNFQAGDFVHARQTATAANGEVQSLVTEFTVTGVAGTIVQGSVLLPSGLNTSDWEIELISRVVVMPTMPSEVIATRFDNVDVRLIGKGDMWTDANTGKRVLVKDLKAIRPVA